MKSFFIYIYIERERESHKRRRGGNARPGVRFAAAGRGPSSERI